MAIFTEYFETKKNKKKQKKDKPTAIEG